MPNPLLNDKAFEKAAGGDVAELSIPASSCRTIVYK